MRRCRPALNYYLLADWPTGISATTANRRFVNERNHANIQKDGTYSVVPRMWGGVTTPAELRAIADAADKYNVPMVKVTGGQRIDLLGVQKEDLPAIWADLNAAGMVSGHAYSKGLRTVKTCVGHRVLPLWHAGFAPGLGIKLEKLLWGSWTPAKVKLGVSGCPRNCAEATCKDIGVVCVDSGYEISVAGAAGMDVQRNRTSVQGRDRGRGDGNHRRLCPALPRKRPLSAPHLQMGGQGGAGLVPGADRRPGATARALYDRFMLSQSVYQTDPWAEHAAPPSARNGPPLADLTLEAAE